MADRTVTIVPEGVALGTGAQFQNWRGLIGRVPLETAFAGTCPLCPPLRLSNREDRAMR